MDAPSDELKGLASHALSTEDEEQVVLDWVRFFLGLPIAEGSCIMSDSSIVEENFSVSFGAMEDRDLFSFHADINHCIGDVRHNLPVRVHKDGTASIDNLPHVCTDAGIEDIPAPIFLEGTDIPGFRGTWEQVFRKLIELNDFVAKQIPEVPDDLKNV